MLRLLFVLMAFPYCIFATELKPWLGTSFEFQSRAAVLSQTYEKINTGRGNLRYSSHDKFYNLSLALPVYQYSSASTPHNYNVELEVTLADTRHRSFGFDNIRLTGRRLLLDDLSGDSLSLIAGATLTQAFKKSLHDIGSFHHGLIEGEIHVSMGKENSFMDEWLSRYWAVLALGSADIGWPWVRANAVWEKKVICKNFRIKAFVNSLLGLGHHALHSTHSFRGYGGIQHRSVDVGVGSGHVFDFGGDLSLEYSYRIYAKNFPKSANIFQIHFYYSFYDAKLLYNINRLRSASGS